MEINITSFFVQGGHSAFSASRAERGQNAGPETWANSLDEARAAPMLTTEDQLDALREHMAGYGAWDAEEIAAWDAAECNALFIQLVSGDIREADLDADVPDWTAYEEGAQEGQNSSNMFQASDGAIYYTLSNY